MKLLVPVLLSLSFLGTTSVLAQTCAPPAIVANANSNNLFSPQQEMALGDLTVQKLSNEFRELHDPVLLAYVESIGAKIIKHLPATGLKFHFHIIDYPEANAFNIPGGHIFIARKLIAFTNSEDELASVIGHELGHATVHHGAIDMSETMRKVLKVTSLGDEKDVIEKYNLLIENARTKRVSSSSNHEDDKQMEADRIGFYAMVAAGYDPSAVFTFFDRLTESEGKTGSWFSDIFGSSNPNQKRLREISQSTGQLPKECRDGRSARPTDEFLKWQADVVMFHDAGRKEELPGLVWKKEIAPKLRSDIKNFAFSGDGRILLAQDEYSITVIDRTSQQVLFQIPAEDADEAMVTPDNRSVIFVTQNLRYEKWDIAQKKNLEARELVLKRDCWEHELSPDGNYLACVDTATTIKVVETKTGKKLWEKKEFYPLSTFEYLIWLTSADSEFKVSFFRVKFTPDSRYVLFSRSNKYRFRISVDALTVDSSENTLMALDMTTLKPIDVGGDLKKLTARPYDFIDATHILGSTDAKLESGGVFGFPDGKRQQKLEFGGEELKHTANPNYFVIKPLANGDTGIYDIKKNSLVAGLAKKDVTMWNDIVAMEATSGKVLVRQVAYSEAQKAFEGKDVTTIDVPAALIADIQTAEISDNFNWLALSSKTRGGLWDLNSGDRKVFTRGFRSAVVDQRGISIAEFPKESTNTHSLAVLNSANGQATQFKEIADFGVRQYGRFLLTRSSIKTEGDKDKKAPDPLSQAALSEEQKAESKLRRAVTFELKDWLQDKVIWTRDFPGGVPRYSFDSFSGRLIFYWWLGSEEGKELLKNNPSLKAQSQTLGDNRDDYVVEVVDAFQQKTIGMFPLETGKGSFSVHTGRSEGDWLMVHDTEGRVLAYSIRSGTLKHRYFGDQAAISPTGTQMIVQNFPGEVSVYSLETGNRVARLVVNGKVIFLRFSLAGDKVFLFSDSQTGYVFDLKKMPLTEERIGL